MPVLHCWNPSPYFLRPPPSQVVWSSLRASAQHIDAISFDAVAFGCIALAKKHETQEDALQGSPLAARDAPLMQAWAQLIAWCMALYRAPPTQGLLAEAVGTQVRRLMRPDEPSPSFRAARLV